MPRINFLRLIFLISLLFLSLFSHAQMEDIEKQLLKAQAEIGEKLGYVADGLELYNLAKNGDLNQAALYFQKKTGIHIYPAFLFRTKLDKLNKFIDDYNHIKFKKLPEPYIILLFTITDTTATFQYELSPTLMEKKAELEGLLQSKAGGFAQGGNKRKFLSGMKTLAFNLTELADQMSLEGLVDKIGMIQFGTLSFDIKSMFQNSFLRTKDTLTKIRNEDNTAISLYDKIDTYNTFSIKDNIAPETSEEPDLSYETNETDVKVTDFQSDDPMADLATTFQKEKKAIARKVILDKVIAAIEFIIANEQALLDFAAQAQKDIQTFDFTKIDLSKLSDKESLEKEVRAYVMNKMSNFE